MQNEIFNYYRELLVAKNDYTEKLQELERQIINYYTKYKQDLINYFKDKLYEVQLKIDLLEKMYKQTISFVILSDKTRHNLNAITRNFIQESHLSILTCENMNYFVTSYPDSFRMHIRIHNIKDGLIFKLDGVNFNYGIYNGKLYDEKSIEIILKEIRGY